MNWQKRSNPFVIALLRSPLHGLFDTHTMLITLTGRTSGKRSTFPVSSVRDGETLFVISQRDRTWWKNLQGSAPVTLSLEGHEVKARGESFTETETAANHLLRIMQRVPAYQRLLHIGLLGPPTKFTTVRCCQSKSRIRNTFQSGKALVSKIISITTPF